MKGGLWSGFERAVVTNVTAALENFSLDLYKTLFPC